MSRIVGMDSSYNLMFIGIVVGEWKAIKTCWYSITKELGLNEIHMFRLSMSLKRKVLKLLYAGSEDLELLCVKVNYSRLKNIARSISPRMPRQKTRKIINMIVRDEIFRIIQKYCESPKIIADNELREIANTNICEPREPIELADIVAWFNLRASNIPRETKIKLKKTIIEFDIENKLIAILKKKILNE
ncbi:MAG: hypothetical protein Q6363_000400 [Candidatus Njordarchaeota archaeon]